jgi:hypothetical protein
MSSRSEARDLLFQSFEQKTADASLLSMTVGLFQQPVVWVAGRLFSR